ncbi:hypothetical protein [Mycobacterium sp. 852002-51961_SCH5331710]|uniref:hypothetical protein n=1 Tax=Mycobacterium sp. 852002-51961_SCH5331710 TaxID=1834105 RepID=UPI00080012B2|nr:hypothetical protein [Mycobacterium sp. 852002-51961_SCH5331710]OBB46899.1 hypothetical protein A5752_25055 [Mycobacterium sp. 852002-51961_SCH5331710]
MPDLHDVVMRSHSAHTFTAFLAEVMGMEVQFRMHVAGEVPIEFMGAYAPEANSDTSDATNS